MRQPRWIAKRILAGIDSEVQEYLETV